MLGVARADGVYAAGRGRLPNAPAPAGGPTTKLIYAYVRRWIRYYLDAGAVSSKNVPTIHLRAG